jgi:hypothetical protein
VLLKENEFSQPPNAQGWAMRRRFRLTMAVVCLAVFCLAQNAGATWYPYQDLNFPALPSACEYYIRPINDAQQIVGYIADSTNVPEIDQAFFWDPVNGQTLLQPLATWPSPVSYNSYPLGINNGGRLSVRFMITIL